MLVHQRVYHQPDVVSTMAASIGWSLGIKRRKPKALGVQSPMSSPDDWGFPYMGLPKIAAWFIRENPMKMDDDWGYPQWLPKPPYIEADSVSLHVDPHENDVGCTGDDSPRSGGSWRSITPWRMGRLRALMLALQVKWGWITLIT